MITVLHTKLKKGKLETKKKAEYDEEEEKEE